MDKVTGIFLRKEVKELREKGASWGLSKEQIDEAILRALGERPSQSPPKDDSKTKTKNRSYLCCCLQVAGFILLLPVVLYMALSLLSSANPSIGLYIGQATADLQYPLQRVIRFMSLPFHRIYDLSKLSAWECMVNNPLYTPDKPDCELCKSVKKIAARSSANLTKAAFKRRYYDTGYPVLVRNMPAYGDTEHSFEKFMTFFKENQADLKHDACEFYTNGALNESVKSLTEFLAEWNHYQAAGKTISWKICYGKGLRMLRTMFPRPYCIHSEGALDKSIYLLQPGEPLEEGVTDKEIISEAARGTFDSIWIAQVTGSTTISLFPVDDCENECEQFEFQLNQGDVFFYSQHVWRVTFYNLANEPAIVFSSSFS